MAINCFGNLCVKTGSKGFGMQMQVFGIILPCLAEDTTDDGTYKVVSSGLRALQLLVNENKSIVQDSVPTLVAYLQRHCLSGAQPQGRSGPSVGERQAKRHWNVNSDSEFSDGEVVGSKLKSKDGRLQQNALLCLQAMAKAVPKQLYPYWNKFLPDIPSAHPAPSLISVMRHHELPKVRLAACAALAALLDGSKQYLSVADDRETKVSFTSLSQKVAGQLKDVHLGLVQAVDIEVQPVLLAQEIRCLSVLVKNCTYDRLTHDYRADVQRVVLKRLGQDDFAIKSAVLECSAALLDSDMQIDFASDHSLIDVATAHASRSEHLSVRVAALELLRSIARNAVGAIRNNWEATETVFKDGLSDGKDVIRAASMKMLEQFAHGCSAEAVVEPAWWESILDRYVQRGVADPFYAVRSLSCDWLSHIPSDVFATFSTKRQFACLTLALGMVQDDDPTVRAAACRTLGVYVAYPVILDDQDMLFLIDVATTIPQYVSDPNLNVRIRASWALANLCDAFIGIGQRDESVSLEDAGLGEGLILEMVRAGLGAAKDNDKCRSNGVRALGNIVRICPVVFLNKEAERLVKEVVLVVLKNVDSGTVKARWNACYALTNMLKHPHFPIGRTSWTNQVYESLLQAMKKCKNFKVRIGAAGALSVPGKVEMFGEPVGRGKSVLKGVMRGVVEAMEGVDDLEDVGFGEVKYREQLRDQLARSFAHLLELLGSEDVSEDVKQLVVRIEKFKVQDGPTET
ncbi:HEAT repeat-containing protein 6 [Rhizophlyctis rosea]|uniref:HEAT repeat-containing protein 6 n=1 Tax=Rhizophlyctis rosea TaxID=64517 RepID=A0AAD5S926_9FUNG|nr:HEAT repeat-containing protein 6 [Rhizophlyctis rosea]